MTLRSPLDKAKAHEVIWPQVSPVFEAARALVGASFVYVIGEEDDGPVKIGVAKDPISRLRTMQTGNPRRLRIEHVLLGDMVIEKLLHELWEPFVIVSATRRTKPEGAPGTEWFRAEIRAELFPIIDTARRRQLEYLQEPGDKDATVLERIIRDAHKEHDFVVQGRDQVRLLGAVSGYAVTRPSRI